jgi:23S rRNA (cytidine1920-2'-O)/16S rRNA (cytidine1409-2'-O)-methyltransferase
MKRRLDAALVHRGLVKSRTLAQELIEQGVVYVNGIKAEKSSNQVSDEVKIEIVESQNLDVGRGASKLRNALREFHDVQIQNKVCLDVGASTGGFTQVLLENNAKFVYALDVGYGQIDWSLRSNSKVKVIERFNARHLTAADLPEKMDLIVADLSFISLTKVIPSLQAVSKNETEYLLMVKPQFELEKHQIGDGGVVKDLELRFLAVWKIITFSQNLGLNCSAVAFSGLAGPSGNKEFFIRLGKSLGGIAQTQVRQVIERAEQ